MSEQDYTFQERMDGNLELVLDLITPDMVRKVFRSIYEKALSGDVSAMKLWLSYAVGEPRRCVELETEITPDEDEEGEEWKRGVDED